MTKQQLSDLELLIDTALLRAQNAAVADRGNEAIEHTRNALSDAYRHIRAATDYWVEVHAA